MSKLFKCDLCNRVFSRREHLIRHHNRKIPCINPINPVLNYDDVMNEENNKYLQDELTSKYIIVKKIGEDHTPANSPKLYPETNQDIKVINMELPKQELKDLPKQELKELPKQELKDLPKQELKELPKQELKELPKQELKELPKQELKELPKQELKELPKQELKELPKQELKDLPKPTNTELSKQTNVIPPNLPKKEFNEMTQEIKTNCRSKTASKNRRVIKEKKPLTSKEKEFFKNEFDNIKILEILRKRYTEEEIKNRYLKTLNIFELKNFRNCVINDLNEEYKRHGIKQITDIDNLNEAIKEYNKYKDKIKILDEKITLTAEEDLIE
jgi:hypothetical protein